jgi:dipeptidyl aminopeptidase/acylaminoacyl peptidase
MTNYAPKAMIYGMKTAVDPQISPDGAWVVYGLGSIDAEKNKRGSHLWLCRRDGSDLRQLTYQGTSNGNARWSPDGQSIAFTSNRDGDIALFVLDRLGGDPKKLVSHRNGIAAIEWSPDGRKLAYTAVIDPDQPDTEKIDPDAPARIKVTSRIDYHFDTRGWLGDKRTQLFVYDLSDSEEKQLTSDPFDHGSPRWSPDRSTLAFTHSTGNGMFAKLVAIEIASGETRELMPGNGSIESWTWTADGEKLLVVADLDFEQQGQIYLVDSRGHGMDRLTDLEEAPGSAGAGSAHPVWIDERHALYPMQYQARSGLYVFDVETGQVEELLRSDMQATGFSADSSARYVAQVLNTFESAGEVGVFDREEASLSTITSHNEQHFEAFPPGQWERFEVQRNGFPIEAWIVKPADFDPEKKYPLVLDIHGGPNGAYYPAWNSIQQVMAANDFCVVFSNPRGSSTYGGDFTRAVTKDWGGEDYLDLMAVTDAAIELPYIDAERTGVFGYSYGGYMSSWIIGHTDRFKAAVIGAPAVDLISMFGTSDISWFWGAFQWGGDPWDRLDFYLERSPISHLHLATTPSLILQAEGDLRCPVGQAEMLFATLKKNNVEAQLVKYPGGDHLFIRSGDPSYGVDAHERIVGWFKKFLGEPA